MINMIKKTHLLLVMAFIFTLKGFAQESPLRAGPMVGHVEMQEANIWLQTMRPANVTLRYWKKGEKKPAQAQFKGRSRKEASNTLHITLSGLDYGTQYSYEIMVNGRKVETPYSLEFNTQPLWQWRKEPSNFTVALGSCLYINDPEDDRPGKPYGGDPAILETIAEMNPDIMLWLGDNVYYREPDFYDPLQMDARYRDARDTPEMQELLATAVNLATWDDHDYGPNNSDRSYRMREEALKIFKRYWANPGYGTGDTDGIFTRYLYNDVEFFLMDDRFHRAPNRLNDPAKDFFGREQLQWLMDGLVSSQATFKIVVVGNQVTNRMNRHEAMVQFKEEYQALKKFLHKEGVEGVLFVSGDRHFTELLKTERGGHYPIYEFTSSPLSAGNYGTLDEAEEFNNPQRVEGTLVYEQRNFGVIRVGGSRGERTLTLQAYSPEGEKLWEHTIGEKELKN